MYWFTTIHLLTSTKKTFPALEIQRQLGHKRYKPIWEMGHKIRSVMGQRDSRYKLSGVAELVKPISPRRTSVKRTNPLNVATAANARQKSL